MRAGEYNTGIDQGSTFRRTFNITDSELDLTSYDSVRMKIRRKPGSQVIWDSDTEDDDSLIEIVDSSTIRLYISADVTETFKFVEAGYDIELTQDGPPKVVDKLLRGTLTLLKEYTK
jgi:hypothetical protein